MGMPGIESALVTCKASTLLLYYHTVLALLFFGVRGVTSGNAQGQLLTLPSGITLGGV